MNPLAELRETFRREANELLDELAKLLESLRSNGEDPKALIAARRIAHNLKGAATTVDAPRLAGPCHALEDEFEAVSKANTPPSAEQIETWLFIVTELQGLVDDPHIMRLSLDDLTEDAQARADGPAPAISPESDPKCPAEARSVADVRVTAEGPLLGDARSPGGAANTPAMPTIRVETRRLDDMMAHVREVAQTQVRLAEQTRILQELCDEQASVDPKSDQNGRRLHEVSATVHELRQDMQDFGHLVDSLSESLNRVRMAPLSGIAPFWQRAVRESANALARPAQLEIDVGETEIDIHVIELIKDPLLHILRNAVAHGIEPADVRQAAGKPHVGRIRLEARADGAFVDLRVSDDGRGIDPQRIAKKAVERGWVTAAAADAMSDAERRGLVFLPGFSTAEVVTTIAGRGMGLHSVQRNLEELGGRVTVSSAPDLGGTTFVLRIPATVLSMKGLLVQSGSVVYALPLYDVAQVAAVASADLEQSEGQPVFRDASERPIRVHALDALLGRPVSVLPPKLFLVVLRRTGQELALVVDSVLGEREFVTHPMPWNLDGIRGINGTLILPDGTVALSLDSTVLLASMTQNRSGPAPAPTAAQAARGKILVVDDSLSVRTLESQTLSSAGFEVSTCSNGADAWSTLEREHFDLVVSDIQMPQMDGLELTTRIRASATLSHLPVILVTGLSSPTDIARGAQVGADGYIVKGELDQEKLIQAVSRLLH